MIINRKIDSEYSAPGYFERQKSPGARSESRASATTRTHCPVSPLKSRIRSREAEVGDENSIESAHQRGKSGPLTGTEELVHRGNFIGNVPLESDSYNATLWQDDGLR